MEMAAIEGENGRGDEEDGPRLCAVTRATRPKDELIRFVAGPAGTVVPDIRAKLPGRGVWVSCSQKVVGEAARSGVFSRGLKRPAKAEPGLPALVGELLRRAALDRLSLANKAGMVLPGFEKIAAAIASGEPVFRLLHASDAAEGGSRKLDLKLAGKAGADAAPPILLFSSAELSLAIGRSNVIHAALKTGGASRKLIEDALRLERYLADGDAPPTD